MGAGGPLRQKDAREAVKAEKELSAAVLCNLGGTKEERGNGAMEKGLGERLALSSYTQEKKTQKIDEKRGRPREVVSNKGWIRTTRAVKGNDSGENGKAKSKEAEVEGKSVCLTPKTMG